MTHDRFASLRRTALIATLSLCFITPKMDGIESVTHMLKIRADSCILLISALADKATAIEAIKRGANGFLGKPFGEKELNIALDRLLKRVAARRAG